MITLNMLNRIAKLQSADSPPEMLLSWLSHPFSLTEKLKNERGEAVLTVLRQEWDACSWWDRCVLGLMDNPVMHREILMTAQNKPCWYARTIIPHSCYERGDLFFKRLEHESLGVIVFSNPAIKRECIIYYPINSSFLEYYWLPPHLREENEDLWIRLSLFSLQKTFFCLIEILLPELLRIRN
ncbi:chorismate--pyruvate lyase family protein [Legionella hackeliae]|nr:chorismate lyase [Legionella hackeliae]